MKICNGQTASLQITSDRDAVVEIFAPIEGAFQTVFFTDKFQVSPKQTVIYKTDVKEYSCLQINISNTRCCVWVFPGDSITLRYVDGRLAFSGSNAPGHRYYYTYWNGTMWFVNNLRSLVLATEDYSGIGQKFIEKFVNPATEEMAPFLPADSVSAQFAGVLKRDIIDYQYGELWKSLREIHLAPANVRISHLFNAVILDNKYGSMGFEPIDVPEIIRYMQSIAPESEGLQILKKYRKKSRQNPYLMTLQFLLKLLLIPFPVSPLFPGLKVTIVL